MKVQVFVTILGLITAHAFAAVIVPESNEIAIASQAAQLNKEFKIEYAQANWFNAWISCLSCGMRLASITSQAEQDTVLQIIKENKMEAGSFWIAGNDIATQGRFNWFTSGELFRYTSWAPGEPNNSINGTEHCVELQNSRNHMWNDARCEFSLYYICEKSNECF